MVETSYSYRYSKFSGFGQLLSQVVEGFSTIAAPLTELTNKKVKFEW